jgi:hypothetical protein
MTPMFFIIRLIASLNISADLKTDLTACLTACTLYGVQKVEKAILIKRYQKCKKEILK